MKNHTILKRKNPNIKICWGFYLPKAISKVGYLNNENQAFNSCTRPACS